MRMILGSTGKKNYNNASIIQLRKHYLSRFGRKIQNFNLTYKAVSKDYSKQKKLIIIISTVLVCFPRGFDEAEANTTNRPTKFGHTTQSRPNTGQHKDPHSE